MDPHSIGIDPHLAYFLPFFGLFAIVSIFIYIIPFWMIFKKAGFSPWFSLLLFVPLANMIILYVVAFSQWKVAPLQQYQGTTRNGVSSHSFGPYATAYRVESFAVEPFSTS